MQPCQGELCGAWGSLLVLLNTVEREGLTHNENTKDNMQWKLDASLLVFAVDQHCHWLLIVMACCGLVSLGMVTL